MERGTFQEDSNKMQKLKNQSTTRSPAGARLPSYPIHDFPLQTPPTREFRQKSRIISPEKPDSPEMHLLDHYYNKIQLQHFLQKWRQSAFHRQQKKRVFQKSLATFNFDIEPRINSIFLCYQKKQLQSSFMQMKHKLSLIREASCVEVIFRKRMLCKYFGQWQSKLTLIVQHHTARKMKKAEAYQISSMPDMMANLHALLSRKAELETQLEEKEREISDVSAVIEDNKRKQKQIEDEIRDATMENQRVIGLKNGIDHDYKDKIATLKMSLSKEINLTHERIQEGQQRLAQQEKAKKITSNSLYESQEALQSRMTELREKLQTQQTIAIQMRDELLRNDEQQTEISRQVIAIQAEIMALRDECGRMSSQSVIAETANNQTLDNMKDVYQQTIDEYNVMKERIKQNNKQLVEQDSRLESLTRQLSICKQKSKTVLAAFREDDEI